MLQILELIATLLGTLANAGSVLGSHTSSILGATATLVRQGEAAIPVLDALTNHVADMHATAQIKGAPTDAQVATLQGHLASARAVTSS